MVGMAVRAPRVSPMAVILPLVASGGSVVAWTKWRPPLPIPAQADIARSLGPLGTGLSASHGLGTTHGALGLAAAVTCVAGIVGLVLPGRLRVLAAVVVALSSVAIFANGLTGFLSANQLHHAWSTLQSLTSGPAGSSPTGPLLSSVSSAITRNALAPSAAAGASGLVGLTGGMQALRTATSSLRIATRRAPSPMDIFTNFGPR